MFLALDIDKLGSDANLVTRLSDAPLQDKGYSQLVPYLRDRLRRFFVMIDGGARNHPQPLHLGESRNHLLGEPVGEVAVPRIRADVSEGKDRDPTPCLGTLVWGVNPGLEDHAV